MSWFKSLCSSIVSLLKGPNYDAMLPKAVQNLKTDNPMVAAWWQAITVNKGLTCKVVKASLEGDVEARTHISETEDPWIEVDVFKVVTQKRDRLEPVLGHEIGHVYDAYFVYGVADFQAIVAREAQLPWDQRTVEKSAIAREDLIRQQLLRDHPEEYKHMPATRERQNQLASSREV
jgi:hypothetical protein